MRIFAFTTLAVNHKLPTRVSTYWACKYAETKSPWLLSKSVWKHIFKTLLNSIRVWLTARRLYISPSVTPLFIVYFSPTCRNTAADPFPTYLYLVLFRGYDLIKLTWDQLR